MDVMESSQQGRTRRGSSSRVTRRKGTIVPMEAAHMSNMTPNTYKLGAGPMKYGSTGGPAST